MTALRQGRFCLEWQGLGGSGRAAFRPDNGQAASGCSAQRGIGGTPWSGGKPTGGFRGGIRR